MRIRTKDLRERAVVYVCVIDDILASNVSRASFKKFFGKSVNSDVMAYSY